jgi:peptidoglycan/xylan/chitin deacetylase (PgdA/CDA1 family)
MAPYDLPPGWAAGPPRGRRTSFVVVLVALALASFGVALAPSISAHRAATPATDSPPTRHPSHHRSPARNVSSPSATADATSPSASPITGSPSAHPVDGSTGAMNATLEHLVSLGQPIYCGAPTRPLVALTFDDGPGILTPQALHQLRSHHAPATFFLVGKLLEEPAFVDIARREAALGMAFGDHTWDHVMMAGRSQASFDAEIGRTRRAVQRATHRHVDLFRPPYGRHDDPLDAYVQQQGMLEILWTIDSEDSQGANADQIYRNVRRTLSAGDIVLLHDNRGTTESALPRILDLIEKRGLTPVTVPELLTQDPPSDRQVRQHTCG